MSMEVKKVVKSFGYARKGIAYVFKNERNFRIHCLLAFFVIMLSFFLHISVFEFFVVLIMSCVVMVLEMINSALEKCTDIVKPRLSYQVEIVKDIMAGAVAVASLFALIIGIFIFIPYLI